MCTGGRGSIREGPGSSASVLRSGTLHMGSSIAFLTTLRTISWEPVRCSKERLLQLQPQWQFVNPETNVENRVKLLVKLSATARNFLTCL